MGDILDFYKQHKPDDIRKAREYLFEDTLARPLYGDDKIKELDGIDMETAQAKKPVVGMIYTFNYKGAADVQKIVTAKSVSSNRPLSFGDNLPVVLFLGMDKDCLTGLNLNFLGSEERAIVVDELYTIGYDKIMTMQAYSDATAKIPLKSTNIDGLVRRDIVKSLSGKCRMDLSYIMRKYKLGLIGNVRMIEPNLWRYIPLLDSRRTVEGADIADIWTLAHIAPPAPKPLNKVTTRKR